MEATLNMIWKALTIGAAGGAAWVAVKLGNSQNSKEIAGVKENTAKEDKAIEARFEERYSRIEEKIGNLNTWRDLKTDRVEENLKGLKERYEETSARFEACRSTCPLRQKKGHEELENDITDIKNTLHNEGGMPRFVPVPDCKDWRQEIMSKFGNVASEIKSLNEKIDRKDTEQMLILNKILGHVS